jgi:hypothetical protein
MHAAIAVESDNQQVGLRARKRERLDMTGVQQVEASVGECDPAAGAPLAFERRLELFGRMNFALLAGMRWAQRAR